MISNRILTIDAKNVLYTFPSLRQRGRRCPCYFRHVFITKNQLAMSKEV
jgi:hypothetical protein